MVTYKQIFRDATKITYSYHPEGHASGAGLIIVYGRLGKIVIAKHAEADYEITYPVSELIKIRNNSNNYRISKGLKAYSEKEYPTPTEDIKEYYYAGIVIRHFWNLVQCHEAFPGSGQIGS